MPYQLVDGGQIIPGEMRFTSYSNAGVANETGQIVRIVNRDKDDVQLYAVRKSVLDFAGGAIQDFPLVPTKDIKIWHATTFIPLSFYQGEGSTLLYFPESIRGLGGVSWLLYRVTA